MKFFKKKLIINLLLSVVLGVTFVTVASVKNNFQNTSKPMNQTIIDPADKNIETVVNEKKVPEPTPKVLGVEENKILNRKINVGIVVDDYANKFNTIPDLEQAIGKKISSVSIYKQFGHPTNSHLIPSDLAYIKSSGKTLYITWEPWNPLENMSQSRDYLTDIANGSLDSYISTFASEVKSYSSPVVLRFAHEMNGNWYPWSNRPEEYKRAYIKIVEAFRNAGVTNVKFCWSVNAESVPSQPIGYINNFYPGNAYVDMVGIDGYNFGTSGTGTSWRSFDSIFSRAYNFVTTNYPKPIIITEVASSEEGGSKPDWINRMFIDLNSKYVKVSELIWFNLLKESDWRINSTPTSLSTFRTNLTNQ